MFRHLRREYYGSMRRRGVLPVFLFFLLSFLFGVLGGLAVVSIDQEFIDWVGGSVTESFVSQDILEKNKAVKALIEDEKNTISAVDKTLASTVNIVISRDIENLYEQTGPNLYPFDYIYGESPELDSDKSNQKTDIGGGSGFIISSDGLILTSKHILISDDVDYSVILSDGTRLDAEVIAKDPFLDFAVLKIESEEDFPVVKLGDSDNLVLGQTVIAIGFTLSEYRNTVTKGIISGIQRRVNAEGETLDQAIQTDAAINPGNSGGPLINLRGEVIGINTAVSNEGQGIGFALPINSAKRVIKSVREHGRIIRPWLGVRYVLLNEKISNVNNLPVDSGALLIKGRLPTELAVIPSSPADKAGLKEGDIILNVFEQKVTEETPLAGLIGKYDVGVTVKLKVLRQGEEVTVDVILEEFKPAIKP